MKQIIFIWNYKGFHLYEAGFTTCSITNLSISKILIGIIDKVSARMKVQPIVVVMQIKQMTSAIF
jgi:hypothetical protein